MQLSTLRNDVRSRLVEPTPRFFSDAEINRWINLGYKDFVTKATPCEKLIAFPAVANQRDYNLNSDNLLLERVVWDEKWTMLMVDEAEFRRRITLAPQIYGTRPQMYTQYPAYGPDSRIRLWPGPASASPSTTLTAPIGASDTVLPVVSTAGFPLVGYLTIGSEQIQYDFTDATNFRNCRRGDAFTTAATAILGATVNSCQITIHSRYMPPDLVNDTDSPRLPEAWQEALILYAAKIGLEKLDKIPQAQAIMAQYERLTEQARGQRVTQQYDRPFAWTDEVGQYYPYW